MLYLIPYILTCIGIIVYSIWFIDKIDEKKHLGILIIKYVIGCFVVAFISVFIFWVLTLLV